MKIFKFYKDDCVPCKMLSKVLEDIDIPQDVEIVEVDVKKNMDFARSSGITSVPTLMKENGNKLIGLKQSPEVKQFVYQGM